MVTLDDLTTPITVEQWKASIYAVMASVGTPTTTWKPGAVARTIVTATAIMLAAIHRLVALIACGGFLELATGPWLTLLAHHQYNVDRQEATFATGQVRITNTAGGIFDFDPDDIVVINVVTKKTYRNVSAVHIGSNEVVMVDIRAVEAGSNSGAQANVITQFETTYLGLTVTNLTALVGLDAETDVALRIRCVEKIYTLGVGGCREAYSYWAKTTRRLDGSLTGVNRTRVSEGSIYGHVDVTVATPSGAPSADDLILIDANLKKIVLPPGATLTTQSAAAHSVSVTCEVWVSTTSSMTSSEVTVAIQQSLSTFVASLPIGGVVLTGQTQGYVFVDMIKAAIANTPDVGVVNVVVTAPAANVAIGNLEVATYGGLTLSGYHQVTG